MADIAQITPLENIEVVDADLVKVRSDVVKKYLNTTSGQADFSEQITDAKRVLHVKIQSKNGLSDSDMEKVKDTKLGPMHYIIVRRALANIMLDNDLDVMADTYNRQADTMQIDYVLDIDEDNVQDASEVRRASGPSFGR